MLPGRAIQGYSEKVSRPTGPRFILHLRGDFTMQLRWIAIGVVCFSAALLSACGGAAGDASLSSREASALSSKESDRGYSSAKGDDGKDHDKDDCDCDDDDDSKSKSRSKDDDKKPECKDDDHDRDHDKSKDK